MAGRECLLEERLHKQQRLMHAPCEKQYRAYEKCIVMSKRSVSQYERECAEEKSSYRECMKHNKDLRQEKRDKKCAVRAQRLQRATEGSSNSATQAEGS